MDRGAGKGKQPMAPFESKESNDYETISGETLFGVPPNPIPDQNTHHIISCEYQQGKKPIKDRWLVHLGTEWLLVSTHDQEGYVTKAQMHYVREPFVTELGNYVKSQNLTGLRSLYDGMTQKELRLFANQVLNGKIANYHEDTEPCNCHLDIVTKDAAQGPKRNKTATLNEPSTSSLSRKRKSTQPIDAAFKRIKLSKKKQSPQRSKSVSEQSTVLVFSSGSNSESEEDQEEFVTQPEREDNPQGSSGLFTSRENNGSTLPNRSTSGFVKNLNPLYRQTRSKSQAALLTSQDIALPAEPGHSAIKLLPASKQVQKGQEVPNEHDACAFIFVLPKDFPDDAATRDLIIINQYSHAMETPEQVTSMEYIHFLEDVAAAIHRAYCPDGSGVPMPVVRLMNAKLEAVRFSQKPQDPMQSKDFLPYYIQYAASFVGWQKLIKQALQASADLARETDAARSISQEGLVEIEQRMRGLGASEQYIEWMRVYPHIVWRAASNEVDGFEGNKGEFENIKVQISYPA